MGKDLLKYPNVEEMYQAASEILGYDLLDLSLNGPANKLSRTIYQQPAIVVASLAAVEKSVHLCVRIIIMIIITSGTPRIAQS